MSFLSTRSRPALPRARTQACLCLISSPLPLRPPPPPLPPAHRTRARSSSISLLSTHRKRLHLCAVLQVRPQTLLHRQGRHGASEGSVGEMARMRRARSSAVLDFDSSGVWLLPRRRSQQGSVRADSRQHQLAMLRVLRPPHVLHRRRCQPLRSCWLSNVIHPETAGLFLQKKD